jgi:hypothetical protein
MAENLLQSPENRAAVWETANYILQSPEKRAAVWGDGILYGKVQKTGRRYEMMTSVWFMKSTCDTKIDIIKRWYISILTFILLLSWQRYRVFFLSCQRYHIIYIDYVIT